MAAVFSIIVDMSIKGGVVILAVLLMRLLLLKAPKKFSYLLWSVAAFRLCVPVSFQAVFSIFSLRKSEAVAPVTPPAVTPSTPVVNTPPVVTAPSATVPTTPVVEAVPTPTLPVDTAVTQAEAINWESLLSTAFAVLWLVGLAAMVIWGIVSYAKLYRRMQNAVRLEGNVYASDRISSPFTLGFLKPRIYLPFGLDEREQAHIIAHERYHIKRLDHIVKPFAYLLLAVHWFNPLCWLAFNRMSMDMEMSCDEAILRRMNEPGSKAQYTETLLSVASANRFPAPSPLAFNDGGGAKQRIKHALNWKKPKVWVTALACMLCLVTLTVCAADKLVLKDEEPEADPNSVTGTYEGQTITLSREVVTDHAWALDMQPSRFVNGYTAVCFYSEKNELQCALMNTAGELTTDPADFEYIWNVDANGRAVAMRPDRSYVYIDTRGNVLGDCDGSAIVRPQGTEATWESADDTLLPEGVKDARIYDNQVVVVSFGGSDSGPYGNYQQLYDLEGNRLNETKFRRIGHFDRGLALFDLEGKLGIIDMKGNIVLQSDFPSGSPDASNDFSMNEGYYLYETDGKIGIMKISRSGTVTPRGLTVPELTEVQTFLQDVSNYGFVGPHTYAAPQGIDPLYVLYDGAGLSRTFYDSWSGAEQQAILGTTQWNERFIHPFKFAKADVEALFTAKTGLSLNDCAVKPQTTFPYTPGDEAFMYSAEYEAYYVMHGDGAYLYKAQVHGGMIGADGLYTVYYSDGSTYGIRYAVTLRKTANGYYFVSNVEAREIAELIARAEEAAEDYTSPSLPAGLTAEAIRADLEKRTDLIPFDAVLGGTNYFSGIHILSDRYVYVTAGDDHIYEDLLFQYAKTPEGGIQWMLLGRYEWNGKPIPVGTVYTEYD